MPSQTPRGVPYPSLSDRVDTPADLQELAEWIDVHPGMQPMSEPERNTVSGTARWVGRIIYNLTRLRPEIWDGGSWRTVGVSTHNELGGRDALDAHQQYVTGTTFNAHSHQGQDLSSYLTQSLADQKGDMLIGTGSDAFTRQAVGAPGTSLIADPLSGTGVSWGYPKSVGCRIVKTAGQILPDSSNTFVTFQSEDDPQNIYNAGTNRIVVPAGYSGRWLIQASIAWETVNNSGTRVVKIDKNGVSVARSQHVPATGNTLVSLVNSTFRAVAGDYFQIVAYQNSTLDMDILTRDDSDSWVSADFMGT